MYCRRFLQRWGNVQGLPLSIRRVSPCVKTSVSTLIVSLRAMLIKGKVRWDATMVLMLHLLCNERGELLNFALTKANVDDRNPEVFNHLTKDLFGKLYADKGYISQSLFASLFDRGVHIVAGIRTNMKNRLMDVYDKTMLRRRSIIETINDMLKNVAQIVHTRHRSVSNFIVNLLAGMAAYTFYDTKPSINMEFEMVAEAEVKQLTLF